MILKAVEMATGIDTEGYMVGNDTMEAQGARKVALEMFLKNLGFMGADWISRQLGYSNKGHLFGYLNRNRFPESIYEMAQDLYDEMVRDANKVSS